MVPVEVLRCVMSDDLKDIILTVIILLIFGLVWFFHYLLPKDAVLKAASECSGNRRSSWTVCMEEAEADHGNLLLTTAGY